MPEPTYPSLETLFDSLPPDYQNAAETAAKIRHHFHELMAAAIQVRLNEYVKTIPQETLEEKRDAASWINSELRKLGLAMKCPTTGNPGILVADYRGRDEDSTSRFRIASRETTGHRTRGASSSKIESMELMPDPPRLDYLGRKL